MLSERRPPSTVSAASLSSTDTGQRGWLTASSQAVQAADISLLITAPIPHFLLAFEDYY